MYKSLYDKEQFSKLSVHRLLGLPLFAISIYQCNNIHMCGWFAFDRKAILYLEYVLNILSQSLVVYKYSFYINYLLYSFTRL